MTTNEMIAQDIWHAIYKNLSDRSGFDHWWDNIDSDTQEEIRGTLEAKITKILDEENL